MFKLENLSLDELISVVGFVYLLRILSLLPEDKLREIFSDAERQVRSLKGD